MKRSPEFCAMRRKVQTGKTASLETRAKMSAAHKGRKLTPEAVANQVASRRAGKGWKHTPESKAKLSAVQIGKVISTETRAKMSAARIGLRRSEETKAKMSASRMGIVFSEQTRAKMSATMTKAWEEGRVVVRRCYRYSSLARALHAHLESQGLVLEPEVRFGRFTVDLYDREHHVAYEPDGVFWHDRYEAKYPGYESRRDAYLVENHGLKVVHYTDREIYALTGWPKRRKAVA